MNSSSSPSDIVCKSSTFVSHSGSEMFFFFPDDPMNRFRSFRPLGHHTGFPFIVFLGEQSQQGAEEQTQPAFSWCTLHRRGSTLTRTANRAITVGTNTSGTLLSECNLCLPACGGTTRILCRTRCLNLAKQATSTFLICLFSMEEEHGSRVAFSVRCNPFTCYVLFGPCSNLDPGGSCRTARGGTFFRTPPPSSSEKVGERMYLLR